MHDLVHSSFHSRLLAWLRLPSFAGDGLPERMRSTTFALLGLTAAGGLALVAIFAQPGFPLLTPAPLPDQPSLSESIAEAEKATPVHRLIPRVPARPLHPQRGGGGSSPAAPSQSSAGSPGGGNGGLPAPAGADAPAPAGAPDASGGSNGSGGAGASPGRGSDPA